MKDGFQDLHALRGLLCPRLASRPFHRGGREDLKNGFQDLHALRVLHVVTFGTSPLTVVKGVTPEGGTFKTFTLCATFYVGAWRHGRFTVEDVKT